MRVGIWCQFYEKGQWLTNKLFLGYCYLWRNLVKCRVISIGNKTFIYNLFLYKRNTVALKPKTNLSLCFIVNAKNSDLFQGKGNWAFTLYLFFCHPFRNINFIAGLSYAVRVISLFSVDVTRGNIPVLIVITSNVTHVHKLWMNPKCFK